MSDWTDERVTHLRRLWDEGHSASEIGRRLGVSKNSIVGRARRDDLPARPSPINQYATRKDPHRARPRRIRPAKTLPDLASLGPSQAIAHGAVEVPIILLPKARPLPAQIIPRRVVACEWITSDGKPWTKCGKPSAPGAIYCAEHLHISRSPHPRRAEADRA